MRTSGTAFLEGAVGGSAEGSPNLSDSLELLPHLIGEVTAGASKKARGTLSSDAMCKARDSAGSDWNQSISCTGASEFCASTRKDGTVT